jgi:DNA-binding NtrC family response regulator
MFYKPKRKLSIVVVSTDPALVEVLCETVRPIGPLELIAVPEVDEVLDHLGQGPVDLVMIHQAEGEEVSGAARLVEELHAQSRPVDALVLSDRYCAEDALKLLQLGAVDYLSRPLDLKRIAYLAGALTLRASHAHEQHAAHPAVDVDLVRHTIDGAEFLYSTSWEMGRVMDQITRVAPRDITILLGGETGTGKTQLARLIHEVSGRRDHPFLVINCGALSASLIESEMFGHVRGAFTGADREHTGKFQAVGRGTLLLDEIDSLPPALQAKLLRVVENRVFEPVGSNKSLPMPARLIAASNQSLEQEVADGRFRADLFYRLNVVNFQLPPLRQRNGVVVHLARTFAREAAARFGRPAPTIGARAARALQAYPWPGNIRELRNVIERAVTLCDGHRIELDDLPDPVRAVELARPAEARHESQSPAPAEMAMAGTLSQSKQVAEITRIRDALRKHADNRLRAAAELGISRVTLYKKLHKYGLMEG